MIHGCFFKGQANVMTPTDNWQEVTLPHSWNMEDGQYSGKNRLDDNGHAQIQKRRYGFNCGSGYKIWLLSGSGVVCPYNQHTCRMGKNSIFVRFEAAGQVAVCMLMGRCWGNIEGPLPLFVTN